METKDLLVETSSPSSLDRIVNQFGAAVVGGGMPGGYTRVDGCYVVRCFVDPGFIKFAIDRQGYGKVVKEFDGLYSDEIPS